MRKVLSECGSVDDFENYLKNTNGKRGVESNFGVIDANGNAAYYEVSPDSFEKFDVNDSKIAPNGYLIRTNYSVSGDMNKGYGYIRYKNLEELVYLDKINNKLDEKAIIFKYSRSLYNEFINRDFNNKKKYLYFNDCILRYSTVSSTIIKGPKSFKDRKSSELFIIPGWPLKSVVIPFRFKDINYLKDLFINNDLKPSFINKESLKLKYESVLFNKGSGKNYLNLNKVIYNGSLKELIDFDKLTIKEYEMINFNNKTSIRDFYINLKKRILKFYEKQKRLMNMIN